MSEVSRTFAGATTPPNKGMKQTKPAQAMELRSLSPVFDGQIGRDLTVARLTARIIALLSVALPTWALSPDIPLATVAGEADLAVVATLSSVFEVPEGDFDVGRGTLTVERVVFGSAGLTRELTLGWVNERAVDCPRAEPWRHRGAIALWLLKRTKDGRFSADYPKQVILLTRPHVAAALKALRATPGAPVGKVAELTALLEAEHAH